FPTRRSSDLLPTAGAEGASGTLRRTSPAYSCGVGSVSLDPQTQRGARDFYRWRALRCRSTHFPLAPLHATSARCSRFTAALLALTAARPQRGARDFCRWRALRGRSTHSAGTPRRSRPQRSVDLRLLSASFRRFAVPPSSGVARNPWAVAWGLNEPRWRPCRSSWIACLAVAGGWRPDPPW